MKERMIGSIIAASLLASATIVSASGYDGDQGHGPKGMPKMDFAAADLNGDGAITQDELTAQAKQRFDAADANNDGFLSAEEMAAMAVAHMQKQMQDKQSKRIAKLDTDSDGKISFDEMQAASGKGMARMFDRLDRNDDGKLDQEELAKLEKRMGKDRNHKGGKDHDRGDHNKTRGHGKHDH